MIATVTQNKCFDGLQGVYSHASDETGSSMRFGVFMPPQANGGARAVPVLYWLSGLTCTEENFIIKAGAQRVAAELGLAIVAPDTSPRGLDLPGEADSYDFGSGAGFYVDATQAPWSQHYRMYSYVTDELPALDRRQLSGRSVPHGHLRPFDGRTRRARPGLTQSPYLQIRVGLCAGRVRRCVARGAKRR